MDDRLFKLLDAYLENRLTDPEAGELRERLRADPAARQAFWETVEQHVLIEDILSETRGRDLVLLDAGLGAEQGADRPGEPTSTASFLSRLHRRRWTGALTPLAAGLLLTLGLWWRTGGSPPPSSDPTALATVHGLAGEVYVADSSGTTVAATPGLHLFQGQVLQVGDEGAGVEVLFTDGTQVTLGPGSRIRLLPPETAEGKFHLERGAVQVQTSPLREMAPLVVTTNQARITARETRFRLYQEENASRMELAEGTARLESKTDDRAVDLAEGAFVVITDEPQPMVIQTLPVGHCRLRHTFLKAGDAVSFSPDGRQLVASHFNRGWKAWNMPDGTPCAAAPGFNQRTAGLAFTSAPDTVVALGNSGTATLWRVGDPRATATRLLEQQLRCGAVSADGRWLVQGRSASEVAVWEVDAEAGRISLRQSLALKPIRVALASVRPQVAVSQWGGEIRVFEVMTGLQVAERKLKRTPTPLALSADGRFLAAHAHTEGLVLFDLGANTRHNLWAGEGTRVSCLFFSNDGCVLLAGLEDGTVRAWSTEDGRSQLVLDTGHRHVCQVTATADLTLLATVGDNDCVKVWEFRLP